MKQECTIFPIKYNVNRKIDLLTLDKISYLFVNEQYDILLMFYNSTKNSKQPVFDLIILLLIGSLFLLFSLVLLISFICFRLSFELSYIKIVKRTLKQLIKTFFLIFLDLRKKILMIFLNMME